MADMYRSQEVTGESWDETFGAFWFHKGAAVNANQMSENTWNERYAACVPSGAQPGCPLFYELDTDGDGLIDDIQNFTGHSLLPLIAETIYNDPNVWEDVEFFDPGTCQPIIDTCTLDACKKADGSPMEYDKEIEAHRMMCNVKSAVDGNRYMDPTAVLVVDMGDGVQVLGVNDDEVPCPEGEFRPLRKDLYSGIYIQVLAHLYNKFIVGNGSPSEELTVEIRYEPRKLSEQLTIHELPCVPMSVPEA